MEKELLDYASERVEILSKSDTSKQETKEAAIAWKEAVAAGEDAQAATDKLLDFLEGRMLPIDGLISFLESPAAGGYFGEELAATMLAAQKQRKEQGEKYCNCEAHTAAGELLAKFGRIEL